MRPTVHVGYAMGALGYMVAIFLLSADVPGDAGPAWVALWKLLRVPLFAGLVVCLLLALSGGRWRRPLAWPVYVPVVLLAGGYAVWRYGSVAELMLNGAGIGALVVLHRLGGHRGVPS
jgi:hypothetical protein